MSVLVGADPEFFLEESGDIVSAIGKIGGSKMEPFKVEGGALQEDNVLAEINIDPAATCADFIKSITDVRKILDSRVYPLKSRVKSSHRFLPEVLLGNDKAMEFGCDPDYNCWTMEENPPPNAYTDLRTAGGHVHIGYDEPTPEESFRIAQACDILLGIPSVILDTDQERRGLYGKAGACRIKAYGVEYRTLSNFWLSDMELMEWIYNQAQRAPVAVSGGYLDQILSRWSPEDIQEIINSSDVDAAYAFVTAEQLIMPEVGK